MDFKDIDVIKKSGFEGFLTFGELRKNDSIIPPIKGVYLILYLKKERPEFVTAGTGGFFKGRNPNVSLDELRTKWLDGMTTIYIGKAGGKAGGKVRGKSKATLHRRLRQYVEFGGGKPVGHWGGRYIWQIKDAENLVVCWKTLEGNADPEVVETSLLQEFKEKYKVLPFANLKI